MPDKRKKPRKRPEQLVYVDLGDDNGGILLNASEEGFSFQAVGPVLETGTIHFRFTISKGRRIEGDGELTWTDESKKVGGLRFTNVTPELRAQVRTWLTQGEAPAFPRRATPVAVPLDTLAKQRRAQLRADPLQAPREEAPKTTREILKATLPAPLVSAPRLEEAPRLAAPKRPDAAASASPARPPVPPAPGPSAPLSAQVQEASQPASLDGGLGPPALPLLRRPPVAPERPLPAAKLPSAPGSDAPVASTTSPEATGPFLAASPAVSAAAPVPRSANTSSSEPAILSAAETATARQRRAWLREQAQREAEEKQRAEAAKREAAERQKIEAAAREADEKQKAEAAAREAEEQRKAQAAAREAAKLTEVRAGETEVPPLPVLLKPEVFPETPRAPFHSEPAAASSGEAPWFKLDLGSVQADRSAGSPWRKSQEPCAAPAARETTSIWSRSAPFVPPVDAPRAAPITEDVYTEPSRTDSGKSARGEIRTEARTEAPHSLSALRATESRRSGTSSATIEREKLEIAPRVKREEGRSNWRVATPVTPPVVPAERIWSEPEENPESEGKEVKPAAPAPLGIKWAVVGMIVVMAAAFVAVFHRPVGEALVWLGQKLIGSPN